MAIFDSKEIKSFYIPINSMGRKIYDCTYFPTQVAA